MNGWHSVTRSKPCKICGGPDNCTESDDGKAAYCGRVSEGSKKQNNGGQSLHIIDESPDSIAFLRNNPKPTLIAPKKNENVSVARDWGKISDGAFNHINASSAREELSKKLGVSVSSLERLGVGWFGRIRGWSMPERDATGKVIGINRRLLNGDKRRERGSNAGLTFILDHWLEYDGPSEVHLVEGFSDTACMLSMDLSAVGRPSNLGGVEQLGELLKAVPTDRRILVVGERDRKSHASLPEARRHQHKSDCECCSVCWPGKFGAIRTAERLAAILNRVVSWTLPPEGSKDVRSWMNEQQQLNGKAEIAA